MGCGKPIICTNVGGNPELIQDGHNGYLVDVGDVKTLSNRILRILGDTGSSQKLGERAQRALARSFSLEQMISSYTRLYDQLGHMNGATN